MATAFSPLLDTNNPYQPTPQLYTPRDTPAPMIDVVNKKEQVNPIVEPLSSVQDKLKAEGSGASTLTTIAAWLGAAKGDFRGLLQIEEQKRRTALAKSMTPEITKVNKLVQSGKWEEASDYVNELFSSYGARADYLVPYFQQMQADIKKKQEGWKNLEFLYKSMKGTVNEDNPNYPVYKALEKAVIDRDQPSETTLQGFMTRYGSPHIQVIDGRVTYTSPIAGTTKTEQLPAVVKGSDMDNFAGNTVAAKHGLNTKQLADVMNGLSVTADTGDEIKPNSKTAQQIKTQFNALQPINARLEMAALAQIPPEVSIQLLKDHGLLKTAIRDFGEGAVDKAITEDLSRKTQQQIAVIKGTEAERTITPNEGFVVYGDESDPNTFLSLRTQPTTINEVNASKGNLLLIPPTVMPVIQQNQSAIQGLDTVTEMLNSGTKLQTTGNKLFQGLLQRLSSYIGYPIGTNTEVRQMVKTILNTAIEQIENTALMSPGQIRGGDRVDIADLKKFASGDFKSEKEVLNAVDRARTRLTNMTKMVIGKTPPVTSPAVGGKKPPVEALSSTITKGQRGRQHKPGPVLGQQPATPEYNEEDAVKRAIIQKRMQKVR